MAAEASAAAERSRRLVVVVIKKEPNQLYGAVGTVARLGTTRVRVKRTQRYPLNQMRAERI